jgi:PadR family transcriptional regulator PadR
MKRDFFLNGLPDLLVLRLLSAREMYGYEIVAEIRRKSAEVFQFGEGCIYPILHRLVDEDVVKERRETVEGRVRRYYRLTAKGAKRLAALQERWEEVAAAVHQIGVLAYV